MSCKDGDGKTATSECEHLCAVSVLPSTCGRRLSTRSGRQGRGRERPKGVGRAENGGQPREGQKELEKGAKPTHDLLEINTKVKLEEKQRQEREARAGMALRRRGVTHGVSGLQDLFGHAPGVAVENLVAE